MRTLSILAFASALAAQEDLRNPAKSAADIAAGAKTFRSHCAECHGINGEGGRGPNLATGVYYHGNSDAELLRNISDGIPGTEMPGLFYSPDRVWQVVSYLRSLSVRGAVKGDAGKGASLFKEKGCVQCHRINGSGGRLGPDLSQIGRSRSGEHLRMAITDPNADVRQRYWLVTAVDKQNRKLEGFLMNEDSYTVQFMDTTERLQSLEKAGLTRYRVEKVSRMPSFKASISGSDLDDLVAYLVSLRPAGGSR
jgi:putative heme-binding domain-containing protein